MRIFRQVCRRSLCSVLWTVLLAPCAFAQFQPPSVNSSPNIVGSGARALGMGGAFIAVADDATAASWNPGGLTQLERPEISLVYSWKHIGEDFSSKYEREIKGDFSIDLSDINYFSIAYPFQRTLAGRNFVVSLNYQHQYDFDRELKFRFRDNAALDGGILVDVLQNIRYRQEGRLGTLSPALGFEITPWLSAGMVMNIWDSSLISGNEWESVTDFKIRLRVGGRTPMFFNGEQVESYDNVDGVNYTFGLLLRPAERWQIGAVYHTKFHADVDYTQKFRVRGANGLFQWSYREEERRVEFPSALGLGVAYRFPNDKLTLSLDVTRRNWDEFVYSDRRGTRVSPITGLRKIDSYHEPAYIVRVGGEYVFIDPSKPRAKFLPSLRAGAFYDPEPAGGRPDKWFGLGRVTGKSDDFYGVTLGAGVLIKDRVNIDAAYIYRWGDDVRKDTFGFAGTDADVDQHSLYFSTVIYF